MMEEANKKEAEPHSTHHLNPQQQNAGEGEEVHTDDAPPLHHQLKDQVHAPYVGPAPEEGLQGTVVDPLPSIDDIHGHPKQEESIESLLALADDGKKPRKPRRVLADGIKESIRLAVESGKTRKDVAKHFGVDEQTVRRIIAAHARKDENGEKKRRRSTFLTLQQKLDMIEEVEKGKRLKKDIARSYGIDAMTVRRIVKTKDEIMDAAQTGSDLSFKRKLKVRLQFPVIDEKTLEWVQALKKTNYLVTPKMIQSRAEAVAKEEGIPNFRASKGWVEKFIGRHSLRTSKPLNPDEILPLLNTLHCRLVESHSSESLAHFKTFKTSILKEMASQNDSKKKKEEALKAAKKFHVASVRKRSKKEPPLHLHPHHPAAHLHHHHTPPPLPAGAPPGEAHLDALAAQAQAQAHAAATAAAAYGALEGHSHHGAGGPRGGAGSPHGGGGGRGAAGAPHEHHEGAPYAPHGHGGGYGAGDADPMLHHPAHGQYVAYGNMTNI